MHKEIEGVGMTAEEFVHYDTPDEFAARIREITAELNAAAGNGFELVIAPIEKWARKQLSALGFKDGDALRIQAVPFFDDDSRLDPYTVRVLTYIGSQHAPLFDGDSLPDRVGYYAVNLLTYIRYAREAIADNDAQRAAQYAVSIGQLFALIKVTIKWEDFALRGKQEKENLAAGPQVASEKRKAKAAEKHAVIDKAVCDLLNNRDSARWTNDEIAHFLIDRKLSTLKFGPTKNIVKRIAARERAKSRKP